MARYTHTLVFTFTVESEHPDGDDITSDLIKEGIEERIAELDSSGELEWLAVCLPPRSSASPSQAE